MTITALHPCLPRHPLGMSSWSSLRAWLADRFAMHLDQWPWAGMEASTGRMDIGSQRGDMRDFSPTDPPQEPSKNYHQPVLMEEVLRFLEPAPGKLILDGTLGGGGHSERILMAGARVMALDQDAQALAYATNRLRGYAGQFCAIQANFRHFADILTEAGISGVDGMLIDLGVSSHQLDDAQRGFSFHQNGPLDMRMNPSAGRTAADIVNEESAEELARIFYVYGEEHASRRVARAIVQQRVHKPFATTSELAVCVESVLPKHGKKHPATRVFQALRIAVNDELGALETFLEQAPRWLKPQGRLVIITFHSLEDRMVKQAFQRLSTEWQDKPEWPEPRRNAAHCMKLLTRKPVAATEEEINRNPRARSAHLRAAERLPV